MANQEHLDILKQGVDVWNRWRKEHPEIKPSLPDINLAQANLKGVDFSDTWLSFANFQGASLIDANFSNAILEGAELENADLSNANLRDATLHIGCKNAIFRNADLSNAQCQYAEFSGVNFESAALIETNFVETGLDGAKFEFAQLTLTYFYRTYLDGSDFSNAYLRGAAFCDVDLRYTLGLDKTATEGPFTIGIDTIVRSKGNIPKIFLREAGIPESFIENIPAFIGAMKPIDFHSCFVSYCSKDDVFVKQLYNDLRRKRVKCWYAAEDLKTGDKFWYRINESIKLYGKLLVVLSKNSVESPWVEKEVMAAIEKEHQNSGKTVLFPIRIDDAIMETDIPWAASFRHSRHILDFSKWKDPEEYQKAFDRLLRDLNK
jgi:uncharacterized protein YjbI with pentapeptide repeats